MTVRKTGNKRSRTYISWAKMKQRCNNPSYHAYHRYGGRGITYDTAWETFEGFFNDMGQAPTEAHTLDRIDSDKNYTKNNCRWATQTEQGRNSSACKLTAEKVRLIKGLLSSLNPLYGVKYCRTVIGEQFGVAQETIADIHMQRAWVGIK